MVYPAIQLTCFRNCFALLDFEGRRFRFENPFEVFYYLIMQDITCMLLLFCLQFVLESKIWQRVSNIIYFVIIYTGTLVMFQKQSMSIELILKVYKENVGFILAVTVFGLMFILLLTHMFNTERYNLLLSFYDKHNLQLEYQYILNNLDQSIITDTNKGLKFFNGTGY